MNIYMSMMTEPPEVRTARIEFRFIGKRSRFRIGNRVRVKFEPMRNPVTGEDHFLIGKLPTGLFTKSEEFFSAKNFRVALNGFQFDYPGRNAILATSTWRGRKPVERRHTPEAGPDSEGFRFRTIDPSALHARNRPTPARSSGR